MDTILTPILDSLRSCVCSALEGTIGGPAGCACVLVPGVRTPADWCSCNGRGQACGMAWVRLSRLYSSSQRFPAQDQGTASTCGGVLAAVIEAGVYRCQPMPKGQGQPPDPAEVTQAALVAADDALAIARGIACCEQVTKRPYVLGAYDPRSSGGCGGGAWTLTVQLTRR